MAAKTEMEMEMETVREKEESSGKRVFRGRSGSESKSSVLHNLLALIIGIGGLHVNVTLNILILLFLPLSKALLVYAILLVLILVPIDEKSKIGRRVARYIVKNACSYFPITLHVEDIHAFDRNRAYVLGYEPHSVIPLGSFALNDLMGFLPLTKVKGLASSAVFYTPIVRHVWAWMGLTPASRKNCISQLAAGYSCIVVPGGVQETFHMEHGSETVFLKSRRGFVRIAMEMGAPLVPVFCFGQSNIYQWWKPSGQLILKLSRVMRFLPILFWGILGSPLPHRYPMDVVVGKPIEVEKNPEPSMEEVLELHTQFVEALEDLFERHKAEFGFQHLQLKVI